MASQHDRKQRTSMIHQAHTRRRFLAGASGTVAAGLAGTHQKGFAAPNLLRRTQGDLSGTELRMAMTAGYKADGLESHVLPAFEEQTGIIVTLDNLPYNNLADKLTVSLATGTGEYDLAFIDEPWVAALSPYLLALDDLIARDDFSTDEIIPNALASGQYDGQLVSMAIDPNVPLLWYRTDLFEAAGVEPPTTWDQVLEIAPDVADPYAYALSAKKDVQTSVNAQLFLWSLGGEIITDDGTFGFDSPEGIAAMELFLDIIEICPPGVQGYAFTEVNQAFMESQVAMIHQWASAGVTLTGEESSVRETVGWAPMPGVPQRGVWTLGIPQDSQNVDAAWEFVKFLGGPEGGLLYIEGGSGHSARIDVMEDATTQERFPWADQVVESVENAKARPQIRQWGAVDNIIQTMATEILSGQSTPEEAIQRAAKEVDGVMER